MPCFLQHSVVPTFSTRQPIRNTYLTYFWHPLPFRPIKFTAFDMAGSGRYRSLWEKYLPDAHVIVYVIDSADQLRL